MGFVTSARVTEAADRGGWFLLGCPLCATLRAAGWLIASGRLRLRDVCVYVCVFVFVFVFVFVQVLSVSRPRHVDVCGRVPTRSKS